MESGFHSALWLNLDALFAATARIEPFISRLADLLRPRCEGGIPMESVAHAV